MINCQTNALLETLLCLFLFTGIPVAKADSIVRYRYQQNPFILNNASNLFAKTGLTSLPALPTGSADSSIQAEAPILQINWKRC